MLYYIYLKLEPRAKFLVFDFDLCNLIYNSIEYSEFMQIWLNIVFLS